MRHFVFGLAFSTLIGCSTDIVFEKDIALADAIWAKNRAVVFDFNIQDTSANYDIILNVKAAQNYNFQNLYVEVETKYAKGKNTKDIVSLELNKPNGLSYGKCDESECDVPILFQEYVKFQEKGNYSIALNQHSRLDTVVGIKNLELIIKQTELKKQN